MGKLYQPGRDYRGRFVGRQGRGSIPYWNTRRPIYRHPSPRGRYRHSPPRRNYDGQIYPRRIYVRHEERRAHSNRGSVTPPYLGTPERMALQIQEEQVEDVNIGNEDMIEEREEIEEVKSKTGSPRSCMAEEDILTVTIKGDADQSDSVQYENRPLQIYENYDCRLCKGDGKNEDKLIVLRIMTDFDSYTFKQIWGTTDGNHDRVGGEKDYGPFTNCEDAVQYFGDKFLEKTGWKWGKRLHDCKQKDGKYAWINGGNTEIAPENSHPVKTGNEPTDELMRLMFDPHVLQMTLSQCAFDTNHVNISTLSAVTLRKALQISVHIRQTIINNALHELRELSCNLYSVLPHDYGGRLPKIVVEMEDVNTKINNILTALMVEKTLVLRLDAKTQAINNGCLDVRDNILQVYYKYLDCELQHLPSSTEECKLIVRKLVTSAAGKFQRQIQGIWRVNRPVEAERFQQMKVYSNRRLLWYCAGPGTAAAILNHGLEIPSVTTGELGNGIYLNDTFLGFKKEMMLDGQGVLFLCEVVMGEEWNVGEKGHPNQFPPPKYDSCTAPSTISSAELVHSESERVRLEGDESEEDQDGLQTLHQCVVYENRRVRLRYVILFNHKIMA